MAGEKVPSIGRIVHYVLPTGPSKDQHRPAIIVRVWESESHPNGHPDNLVNLQVFTDGGNDDGPYLGNVPTWAASVRRDEETFAPRTYHFPEYVPGQG